MESTTTTSLLRGVCLAVMTLSTVACTNGDGQIPLSNVTRSTAEAFCEQLLGCAEFRASSEDSAYLSLSASFVEACPSYFETQLSSVQHMIDLVDEGRVTYDASAASACLDGFRDSCVPEGSFEVFAPCREVFVGTVGVGSTCTQTDECEPGTYCTAEDVMGVCTPGVCAAHLALGAECESSRQCARPDGSGIAGCRDIGGGTRVCMVMNVDTGLGEGAPCGDLVESGTQQSYGMCAPSFFCDDPDDDGVGTCRAPIAAGELCEPGEQACVQGAVCIEVAAENRCVTVTVVTEVGGACDDESTLCDYPNRLICESGQCVAMPAGECEEGFHCSPGQYCDGTSETCQALKSLGAECDRSDECVSDYCRDDGTMTGTRTCQERVRCG